MTPERLEELRQRARQLQSDHAWLAAEFAYFAENATDVATARDLMNWVPLRVWAFLTDMHTADRQVNKHAPLSLRVRRCKATSLSSRRRGEGRHEMPGASKA